MKIAWFCIPAHGHTNPTLGVVRELTDAGHEVTYFSFDAFREKIEAAGAAFVSCDACDLHIDAQNGGNRVGRDLAFSIELIVDAALAMDALIERTIPVLKPDLIVADSMAFSGKLAAMKYGVPYVCSTTTFAFNRYTAKYMDQGMGGMLRTLCALPKINRQLNRLRAAGYPVKSFLELISSDDETDTIVYTSREFQPRAETFSEKIRFIGPSPRPVREPMEKTAKKTVYVSMGTVLSSRTMVEACVEALRGTDWQGIVSTGKTDVELRALPPNIQAYDFVDQMAALQIADVFVTHCGMNSASEGLYCKVPLVLAPQTPEQTAVARRVAELGAGVLLPASGASAEDIRGAIETVLRDGSYRAAAAGLSESFRRCGGAKEARAFLETVARRHGQSNDG